MKRFLFLLILVQAASWGHADGMAPAGEQPCLDCLVCEALKDDEPYAEGAMKSVRHITPGKDHWLFRSDVDLSTHFGIPEAMTPWYKRLMDAFHQQHIEVVFAVQPTRGMMHRDKIREDASYGFDYPTGLRNLQHFLGQLRTGGAIVPDIIPLVKQPPQSEYFFRRDHHWTPAGAQATARIVADTLKTLPVYTQLEKKNYFTEKSLILPKDGTMNRALRKICGNNYGFQYVQGFQTVPENSGADALFADEATPEVVLVGTSNSANRDDETKNYNFEGYLKEYLSVDILNYALPGAGQDGALIQYLHSDDYDAQHPPKLLIWELPANFQLESELTYRQLLPALAGGCKGREPLLTATRTINQMAVHERLEILSNTGHQRRTLPAGQGFIDLRLSDRNIKDFYLIVYYDNGLRDKVWYRREAVVDGGQYYLELSHDPKFKGANPISVFIEPTEAVETATTLEARLCI
ncbi:MAG: hypothetical protein H6999_05130 [Hahellaceae bacterium]|nr:hypothetical protein [Hahellaceae bacterium]MCP5169120.1 hypothetical protein [Hahellaceae bacterium]